MLNLSFIPCLADPGVRMRPRAKLNGPEYYGCVLLCEEDALELSENTDVSLRQEIRKCF